MIGALEGTKKTTGFARTECRTVFSSTAASDLENKIWNVYRCKAERPARKIRTGHMGAVARRD